MDPGNIDEAVEDEEEVGESDDDESYDSDNSRYHMDIFDYDSDDPRHKCFPLELPFDSGPDSDFLSDSDEESCACRRCLTFKDLRAYTYAGDSNISKSDVYHLSQLLFKVTDAVSLPDPMKFLPKLIKKIKDKMKSGLQEDLIELLYFPGKGNLPHTVVLQIVEILLASSMAGHDRSLIKFDENSSRIKRTLNGIYGSFQQLHNSISSQWTKLKVCGLSFCEVRIECNSRMAVHILMILDDVKKLIPDFSLEEGQYRQFMGEMKVEQIRHRVEDIMRSDMYETLGKKERKNLTNYVYALRMSYDHVADILTPHVKIQDIVTMCKIYKSAS